MAVVPVAKSMYLCDYHIGYRNGKVDLYGLFNAIRPEKGFPYARSRFCVFAQLINGLGQVPFFIDVRFADTDTLVYTIETRSLTFPDRTTVVQMAMTIEGCQFQILACISLNSSVIIPGCVTPRCFYSRVAEGTNMSTIIPDPDTSAELFQEGTAPVQAFTSPAIRVHPGTAVAARQGRLVRIQVDPGQQDNTVGGAVPSQVPLADASPVVAAAAGGRD